MIYDIYDPFNDPFADYENVLGVPKDQPLSEWYSEPSKQVPQNGSAKLTSFDKLNEANVYTNWLNQGLLNPSPKYATSDNYLSWLNKTKGGSRIATTDQLENPTLAKDIPTITRASFSNEDSLRDSITNAGWVLLDVKENKNTPTEDQSLYTVAKYDPASGEYSSPSSFYVNTLYTSDGTQVTTGQALDAAGGQGLFTINEATGLPEMALGTRAISTSSPTTVIPSIPSNLTLSDYRAMSTAQRQNLKTTVEANGKDWQEWLSGLKNPAPAVVSYAELKTMNATDKATLRQQVEDAGLLWSDYVDQIYSPWSISFSSPRRVTYATYRG